MKTKLFIFFAIMCFIYIRCSRPSSEVEYVYINSETNKGELIADTIIYDVIIKNRDTTDLWAKNCLKYLDRSSFVDSIFSAVYSGKRSAYDLFSGEKLGISQIRKMEREKKFTRESIGKIQFREVWYLNSNHLILEKQVISIVLGAEQYSDSDEFRGYRPVFKVDLFSANQN